MINLVTKKIPVLGFYCLTLIVIATTAATCTACNTTSHFAATRTTCEKGSSATATTHTFKTLKYIQDLNFCYKVRNRLNTSNAKSLLTPIIFFKMPRHMLTSDVSMWKIELYKNLYMFNQTFIQFLVNYEAKIKILL